MIIIGQHTTENLVHVISIVFAYSMFYNTLLVSLHKSVEICLDFGINGPLIFDLFMLFTVLLS